MYYGRMPLSQERIDKITLVTIKHIPLPDMRIVDVALGTWSDVVFLRLLQNDGKTDRLEALFQELYTLFADKTPEMTGTANATYTDPHITLAWLKSADSRHMAEQVAASALPELLKALPSNKTLEVAGTRVLTKDVANA